MTTIEQLLLSKTWFKRIIELNKIEDNYDVPKIADLVAFITEDNIKVENADRCETYFSCFILGWYLKTQEQQGIVDLSNIHVICEEGQLTYY